MWPIESAWAGPLAWLVPAGLVGTGLLIALNREMQDCRASRAVLWGAAASYAIAAAVHLPVTFPIASRVADLLMVGSELLGHLCLFVGMWLYAGHVLHRSSNPSASSRRGFRIPRPHFRLPAIARREKKQEPTAETVASKSARSTRQSAIEPAAAPDCEPLELMSPENSPRPIESDRASSPAVSEPGTDDFPTTELDESGWTEPFPKPDMRGLSKKQRRKLMQELREKERAARKYERGD
jgi:hypothetical protein